MPLIETEEAARRLARAIASDLSLYNEEKIIHGIENDDLFEELNERINTTMIGPSIRQSAMVTITRRRTPVRVTCASLARGRAAR